MSNDIKQREADFKIIYFNEIGMCGCGRPAAVKRFIYELMKNHKEHKDGKITYEVMDENRTRIIKETDTDIVFEFVFHILEHNGLLEHDGSIYGSWFTEKGEKFFNLLSENLMEEEKFKPKNIGFNAWYIGYEFRIYSINGFNVVTRDNERYCFCTYEWDKDDEIVYNLFDKYRSLEEIIKITEYLLKPSF